jgi:hypothetical protein
MKFDIATDGTVRIHEGGYTETYGSMHEVKDRLAFLRRRKEALEAAGKHRGGEWIPPAGMDEETRKMTRENISYLSRFK